MKYLPPVARLIFILSLVFVCSLVGLLALYGPETASSGTKNVLPSVQVPVLTGERENSEIEQGKIWDTDTFV